MLEWDNVFCIGHDLIDRDRQKIFALSNRLYAALRPMNPSLFMAMAKETLVFLQQQFMHEERLLERVNSTERTRHRQIHQAILDKLNELHGKLLDSQGEPKEFMFFVLYEVIVYHMLDYDSALKAVSADLRRSGPLIRSNFATT
jgi:hemerythrin-like metal-binding protein